MKAIIFDASTIISISMSSLLPEFKSLKQNFSGKFVITKEVQEELVKTPMKIRRFQLEALRIKHLLKEKILETPGSFGITDEQVAQKTNKILSISNSMFYKGKEAIKIIHSGEASCMALAKILDQKGVDNLIAIDERTTRMLVEKAENLQEYLEKKLHMKLKANRKNFKYFKNHGVMRSTELMYIAYSKNLMSLGDGKLLEAILYSLKLNGCSITEGEIKDILKTK